MPNNNMAAYVALDNGPKETSNETTIIAIIAHSPLESLSTNSHTAEITELLSQTNDSATAQSRVEDGQRSANVSYPSTSRVAMAVEWVKHMTTFKAILIIYCLNVVAWGGMIFLLLCNAAPAMCHPTCDDINSPRRKCIEIDSQILNALFCAPAFGLAPRRFIEAWQLLRYLSGRDSGALRRLAATYQGWFRLLGSQTVPSDIGPSGVESWLWQNPTLKDMVPHPSQSILEAPLSGKRAMPTALWKLQAVIGLNVMNTVFQADLSGFMWGYNRHTRPSWSVGLFLCLAFAASIAAGVVGFIEGKRIRKIEGLAR